MTPERLLAHYDRIADAPDAAPRMRRFVLDLAVRGKLSVQRSEDGCAAGLLKQISTCKAKLIREGVIRAPRSLGDSGDLTPPFSIPSNWRWVRLDSVGAIVGGGTPPAHDEANFAEPGGGVPWLTPADLGGFTSLCISRGSRDLSDKGMRASSATLMPAGTVLFTSRAPIGYVAIAANPISTNQGFKSIVPFVPDSSRFIAIAMKAFAPEIEAKAPGTTFKEVSGKIVSSVPFPLPPLTEQHRIVAKVDELMALCDHLDAAREKREATRDRLTTATLARLNAPDPVTFPSDARLALGAIPALTTRSNQIHGFRQSILDLAVRGRLVPPLKSELPAQDFLRRIAAAKIRRATETRDRRIIASTNPSAGELSIDLPSHWSVQSFENLFLFIDYRGRTPTKVTRGVPLITAKNIRMGHLNREPREFIAESTYKSWMTRGFPKIGDLFFTTEAPLANVCANGISEPFALAQRVICLQPFDRINTRYFMLAMMSEVVQSMISRHATGMTAKGIKAAKLKPLPLPIPPEEEQDRIVAKVDELMALCDQLEASLDKGEEVRRRLLDALLHEALEAGRSEAA